MEPDAMGEQRADRRCPDDLGLRWVVTGAVRRQRGRDTIEIALDSLVHPFRQGEIAEGIEDVEQRVHLGPDRKALRRARGRRIEIATEGVVGMAGGANVLDEAEAVDDVPGLERLDRGVALDGRRQLVGDQREPGANGEDELVDFGERVPVVQPALQLVAEEGAQALTVADSLEDADGRSYAVG